MILFPFMLQSTIGRSAIIVITHVMGGSITYLKYCNNYLCMYVT